MKAIESVRAFLCDLYENQSEESTRPKTWGQIFSDEDIGSVVLSREEAQEYRALVSGLMVVFSKDRMLSRRAIERELRKAILFALGPEEGDGRSFEVRLDEAVAQLEKELRRDPTFFTAFVPVGGAAQNGLPFTFGKVRFVVFNESQIRKFRDATRKHQVAPEELKHRLRMVGDLRDDALWQRPCALMRVKARDQKAAGEIAVAETRDVVDVLNFFSDLIPYHSGCLFMPGDRERGGTVRPVLEDSSSWTLSHESTGPIGVFEFAELRRAEPLRPALRRMHKILRHEGRTGVDELLTSAVRSAGVATAEPRDEQAFLWYTIALEAVVLPKVGGQELGYRLRTRLAHLLGNSVASRRKILKTVKDLYRVRSKIVHSGWYEVPSHDLERMRLICKRTLYKLLTHRSIASMNSADDLEKWYDNQILR